MERKEKRKIFKLLCQSIDNNMDFWTMKFSGYKNDIIFEYEDFKIQKTTFSGNWRNIPYSVYVLDYQERYVDNASCTSILKKWIRKARELDKYLTKKQKFFNEVVEKCKAVHEQLNKTSDGKTNN